MICACSAVDASLPKNRSPIGSRTKIAGNELGLTKFCRSEPNLARQTFSYRTLRDGSLCAHNPGTSCQATIVKSLRDRRVPSGTGASQFAA
jgi:hypothetical protein